MARGRNTSLSFKREPAQVVAVVAPADGRRDQYYQAMTLYSRYGRAVEIGGTPGPDVGPSRRCRSDDRQRCRPARRPPRARTGHVRRPLRRPQRRARQPPRELHRREGGHAVDVRRPSAPHPASVTDGDPTTPNRKRATVVDRVQVNQALSVRLADEASTLGAVPTCRRRIRAGMLALRKPRRRP